MSPTVRDVADSVADPDPDLFAGSGPNVRIRQRNFNRIKKIMQIKSIYILIYLAKKF